MRGGVARPAWRHLLRSGAALALTAVLVGPSAHATSAPASPAFTPVPGHDSSEWLMMGRHCGDSLT
jgi:hypothetical protein